VGVDAAQPTSAPDPPQWVAAVDLTPADARQVDRQASVGEGLAGHAVAATSHGDLEAVVARGVDRADDVLCRGAARDDRRLLVDHRVPEGPRLVVARLPERQNVAGERLLELTHQAGRGRLVYNRLGHSPPLKIVKV